MPVIAALREKVSIPISIDTYKAEVAERVGEPAQVARLGEVEQVVV